MKRKRPMTWRQFEYTMFIPKIGWDTSHAQRFANFYADSIGAVRKPIVFDLATSGRGSHVLGMHREDRISLSLELEADERWRTLIHELAHYWARHEQRKLFLEALQLSHRMFRQWLIADKS